MKFITFLMFALFLVACSDNPNAFDYYSSSSSINKEKLNWTYLNPNITYDTIIDIRDGQVYKIVTIGEQTWMAENLNYDYTTDLQPISSCYDLDSLNCLTYGRLYTWAAVMDSLNTGCGSGVVCAPKRQFQGICPEGFHVPTRSEYDLLYSSIYAINTNFPSKALQISKLWDRSQTRNYGTDALGFAVLPAGYSERYGFYRQLKEHAYFWNATEDGSMYAYYEEFDKTIDNITRPVSMNKQMAYSLRCIQNYEENLPEEISSSSNEEELPASRELLPCTDFEEKNNWQYLKSGVEYSCFIDERDSIVYKTVTIGTQTWMAENLNYKPIDYQTYQYTKSITSEFETYRYSWSVVMDSLNSKSKCGDAINCYPSAKHQGLGPKGFHVPSREEFNVLYEAVGGKNTAAQKLKATSVWRNSDKYTIENDDYGFSLLPSREEGNDVYLWTSDVDGSRYAYHEKFLDVSVSALESSSSKRDQYGLRCILN